MVVPPLLSAARARSATALFIVAAHSQLRWARPRVAPSAPRLLSSAAAASESHDLDDGEGAAAQKRQPSKGFVPFPFEYHEEIELVIDGLTSLGQGIGRVPISREVLAKQPEPRKKRWKKGAYAHRKTDSDEELERALAAAASEGTHDAGGENSREDEEAEGECKWVVMVPFALPGERVKARVWGNYRKHSQADLISVLLPSSARSSPVCSLFGECGGCQYQHLRYSEQLVWKTRQVRELLARTGRLSELPLEEIVLPAVGSPKEYGYRTKLTPHFEASKSGPPAIGFHRHSSRTSVLDVTSCPIASPSINEALPSARTSALEKYEIKAAEARAKQRRVPGSTLLLRHTNEGVVTDPNQQVSETVGGLTLRFQAGNFFQNNPYTLPLLVDHVIRHATGPPDRESKFMIDAYCGSGLFALSAAAHFQQVVGVETSQPAVECAGANAKANGIRNAKFIAGSAECIFQKVPFDGKRTSVVLDPPRKGCDQSFLKQLLAYGPRRIVYVSCRADTLARDLGVLVNAGYDLQHVQPFDMFPQTRHIENVATLDWVGPRAAADSDQAPAEQ